MWKRLNDLSESDRHAKVSLAAVGLWAYLLGTTDSCGRRSADIEIIKGKCMTLRSRIGLEEVQERIAELVSAGLIHLYEHEGRAFLVVHRVARYNPPGALRYAEPTFPPPPEGLCDCLVFHASDTARNTARMRRPSPSPSPSSSPEGEIQGGGQPPGPAPPDQRCSVPTNPTDDVERQLFQAAMLAKCPSQEATIRKHVKALRFRQDVGAEKLMNYLGSPEAQGKTVNDWQDHFKASKPAVMGKPNPRPKPERQKNCGVCRGTGMVYVEVEDKFNGKMAQAAKSCPVCILTGGAR